MKSSDSDIIKKAYNKHKETGQNFFWRSLQTLSKQGVAFCIFFITAKFLTPEKFGIFNYLMAVIGFLMLFCDFGFSLAISKFVTEYKTKKSEKLNTVLFSISIVTVGICTLISAIVILLGGRIFKDNYRYIIYLLPCLFLMPLNGIVDGVYRGLKEFKKLALISSVVGIFSLMISFFLISRFYLVGAVLSQGILYFLSAVALYAFQKNFKFRFDRAILADVAKYALVLGIGLMAYFLYSRIDILILKQFGFVVEIGYYEVVNKIFQLLFIPFAILGQVIAPNTTKYMMIKDCAEIKNKLKKYAILCIAAGLVMSISLYLGLPVLLKTVLPKYHTTGFLLIMNILLLLLPFKIWGSVLSQGFILPAGLAKITTITTLIGGVLNVILDYVFISIFGFIGVFWVTLMIHSVNILVITVYFYKKINAIKS